jgi:hypothetical protein
MDKWFKDILPDKDPCHNRGRDQNEEKGGEGSGIRVSVIKTSVNRRVAKLYIFPFSLQDCLRLEYISTEILLTYTGLVLIIKP